MKLCTNPSVLSEVVRNVVLARAYVSAADKTETEARAIQACRAAARQRLGKGRLSHAEAVEVDAIVLGVRSGSISPTQPFLAAPAASLAMHAGHQRPSADITALQATLSRIEQLLMLLVLAIAKKMGLRLPASLAADSIEATSESPRTEGGEASLVSWSPVSAPALTPSSFRAPQLPAPARSSAIVVSRLS